ncbi:hypothetical protein [uncultured Draconibacterium sp.]|uniref:hypothetical protein n=1 Tax=uncultured Draconibacterium sp. TaxID=1573823 RepID=UPI003216E984
MHFDHLPPSHTKYLTDILSIIKDGIATEKERFKKSDRENLKNQQLSDRFNQIGTKNEKNWIGVSKENENDNSTNREDIYFYLDDDNRTRIFFAEGKRLPKAGSNSEEEYVVGMSSTGKPSGGIQRFKLGLHGEPETMTDYAIIGYIEKDSFSSWQIKINNKLKSEYPADSTLTETPTKESDYISLHNYLSNSKKFKLHHFWIDLT